VVLLSLASLVGCKTFADETLRTRTALDQNDLDAALNASNAALEVRRADQIPEPLKKNDALLLLDRAMVLQALREYGESSRNFEVADKAIEMLDFSRSTSDEIVKYLFSESAGPYKARPYEKLMLNSLNMVNYLALRDLEDARVEARRFSIMREYLLREGKQDQREVDQAGAFGSYLAGYAFEKSGDAEEALRYYDEVLHTKSAASLAAPVARLMRSSGYRSEQLTAISQALTERSQALENEGQGEILIVVSYGRVPAMVAKRVPIGLALTIAAAFLPPGTAQQARRLAGQGLVTWVNYPELGPTRAQYPEPVVTIDTTMQAFETIANVDAAAQQAWEESRGRVMAAAVVRMVARAAIGAGVGVATGKATNRSSIGVLAALITQAGMAAGDKPDTRSWATLPARVGVVRRRVSSGTHRIEVNVSGRRHVREVSIGAGQWLVIDVTDLSRS
jgi:hypothetical protein